MAFQRTGSCNRCGQCCGADGSPNQANPWPVHWFEHHQQWQHDHFVAVWPYTLLFGIVPGGDGKPVKAQDYGSTRFTGGGPARNYYWVWVNGQPCKDISVAHDGTVSSLECPFLVDDPGDGSRPCGLKDESAESSRLQVCDPEGPDVFATRAMVDQWETDHPLCSHDWAEV